MFERLFKKTVQQTLRPRAFGLIEACTIGLVAALSAVALKEGVGWLGSWRVHESMALTAWYVLPAIGAAGGLLSGVLVAYLAPEAGGSGIPQVKAALAGLPIPLTLRVGFVKLVGCIVALGSGFALGREGPTLQVGAAFSSAMSKWLASSPLHRKQLIAAGAGAGLAAAFNAPLAGVLFVVEELLHDLSGLAVGTAVVACFVGAVVSRLVGVQSLDIELNLIAPRATFAWPDIPFYFLLGAAAGLLGALFNRAVIAALRFNTDVLKVNLPLRMALAGLVTGLVIAALPPEFRNHAGVREMLVIGDTNVEMESTVFVANYFLTLLAFGSGAPGGLFAPTLTLGASLGNLIGSFEQLLIGVGSPATFALVGMGAFFGAVARVPITAIVIVFEMTADFNVVLPLMISSIVACLVAETIDQGSIYDRLLAFQGIRLEKDAPGGALTRLKAADFMQRNVETISAGMTVNEAVQAFVESRHRGFPVVDDGLLVGVVSQPDLANLADRDVPGDAAVTEVMTPKPVTAAPDDSLADVLLLLNQHQISRLPVTDGKRLVGIITRSDIIRAQSEDLMDTLQMTAYRESSYVVYQTRSPSVGRGRLLVPVANPRTAQPLLRLAAVLARYRHFEVECVQVIEIPASSAPSQTHVSSSAYRQIAQEAEAVGAEFDVPVHTQVRLAHEVSDAILEAARDGNVNIILMGWRGAAPRAVREAAPLLDKVIKRAECAVVLANKLAPAGRLNRWLIPVGGGLDVAQALPYVPALVSLAAEPEVKVCQVTSRTGAAVDPAELQDTAARLRRQLRTQVVPFSVCADTIAELLVDLAHKNQYDALVLGLDHEQLLKQMSRGQSIPEAIASKSDCTVFIVRGPRPGTQPLTV